jgi:arylsulfatase A-like enzyme
MPQGQGGCTAMVRAVGLWFHSLSLVTAIATNASTPSARAATPGGDVDDRVQQLLRIADLLRTANDSALGPFEIDELRQGALSEQRALSTQWDDRPNLLLLFPDEWRWDWDTFHPGAAQLRMPVLRDLAARGTRFSHAVVPSPLCAPSRGALAAGREYDEAGMAGNKDGDYPTNQTTWYRLLRDVGGYHTLTAGKDDLTKTSKLGALASPPAAPDGRYHQWELGFAAGARTVGKDDFCGSVNKHLGAHDPYSLWLQNQTARRADGSRLSGFDAICACYHLASPDKDKHKTQDRKDCDAVSFADALYWDTYITDRAVELLQSAPQSQPWFLQVNWMDPHPPFAVTSSMAARVAGRSWPQSVDPGGKTKDTDVCSNTPGGVGIGTGWERCNYAAELENLDQLFGRVLGAIPSGAMARTVVCVSSDHGEMLGDHGDTAKSRPWEPSANVPLVCAGPGILPGRTVAIPVATLDLSATFLDLAGIPASAGADLGMSSVSLRPLLQGAAGAVAGYRPWVASGLNKWRMVVRRDPADGAMYKLICSNGSFWGPPSTIPPAVRAGGDKGEGIFRVLYNISNDETDMHELSHAGGETPMRVVRAMLPLLPRAFAELCRL